MLTFLEDKEENKKRSHSWRNSGSGPHNPGIKVQ